MRPKKPKKRDLMWKRFQMWLRFSKKSAEMARLAHAEFSHTKVNLLCKELGLDPASPKDLKLLLAILADIASHGLASPEHRRLPPEKKWTVERLDRLQKDAKRIRGALSRGKTASLQDTAEYLQMIWPERYGCYVTETLARRLSEIRGVPL